MTFRTLLNYLCLTRSKKTKLYFEESKNGGSVSKLQTENNADVTKIKTAKPHKTCADSFKGGKKWKKDAHNWLLTEMKDQGLVNKYTHGNSFQKIFSGKSIDKPIIWTGQIDELAYFITQMRQSGLIELERSQIWLLTCKCFGLSDGRSLNHRNMKGLDRPKKADAIDQIVSEFGRKAINDSKSLN